MQKLQYAKTSITIDEFQEFCAFLEKNQSIQAAILFGSVARGDANYHSDIDIALWVTPDFNKENFVAQLKVCLTPQALVLDLPRKQSLALFLNNLQKIDLRLISEISVINKHYLGSAVPKEKIEASVLFDKTKTVLAFLQNLTANNSPEVHFYHIPNLINYFLFNFTACSKYHAKSDAYRFYFNYNIALNTLVQLQCLLAGKQKDIYAPRNIHMLWASNDLDTNFEELSATLNLPKGNEKKRLLLNEFYRIVALLQKDQLNELKHFCEAIYQRDYFWNFRDFNRHNMHLQSGILYRSASLSLYQDTENTITFLKQKNIRTIIDLRAPKEINAHPYQKKILDNFNYVQAPFDPWNQPDWFKKNHHHGSNRTIAYRFFLMACQASFKQIIHTILHTKGAVLLHCHAGKDRTGLVIGAIQLLLGCDKDAIICDYLASGSDSHLDFFNLLFKQVDSYKGIQAFFEYQGISKSNQSDLIKKLSTNE